MTDKATLAEKPFSTELESEDSQQRAHPNASLDQESGREDEELLFLSPAEERKLLRRIDLAIVPYSSLLYLLSFLDRTAISQARLAGLETDLNLHGNQYSIALSIFFISYIIFEVPSNILLKRLKPNRWICFIMVAWSLCQIGMGLTRTAGGLYACRWFLGMFEAGLYPGLNFVMTCWYTRDELNRRISVFYAGSTLAGAFGGLLAFGIRNMEGLSHKGGWAWIFILEGGLTLLCAIPAWWIVPGLPYDSKILNERERAQWLHRLNRSQGVTNTSLPFTKRQVIRGFASWRTYVYGLIDFCLTQTFYAASLFFPSVVAGLGFTNAQANLLSAAPYCVGTIATLLVALVADKYAIRGPIIIASSLVIIVGYMLLLFDISTGVKYLGVFFVVTGLSASAPAIITWVGTNCGPVYTRATVFGIFFTIGNSAGPMASSVYPASEGPKYIKGNCIGVATTVLAIILTAFLSLSLRHENARRDKVYGIPAADGSDCSPLRAGDPELQRKWGLEGMKEADIIELGDSHPAFRYIW